VNTGRTYRTGRACLLFVLFRRAFAALARPWWQVRANLILAAAAAAAAAAAVPAAIICDSSCLPPNEVSRVALTIDGFFYKGGAVARPPHVVSNGGVRVVLRLSPLCGRFSRLTEGEMLSAEDVTCLERLCAEDETPAIVKAISSCKSSADVCRVSARREISKSEERRRCGQE